MVSIENTILRGLIYNEEYARKVMPHLTEDYFDAHYKPMFRTFSSFFSKYNEPMPIESFVLALNKSKLAENDFESCLEELAEIQESKDEPVNVDWLVDETEQYCKDKAMYNALYKSISIIEGNNKDFDVHAVPTIMQQALAVAFNNEIGSDYTEEFEHRLQYYLSEDIKIPFPLEALNILSNGGLRPKTLSAILAGTNVGKSAMMCYLAGEWMKEGRNVLYITLEMSEEAVQERIDANLLDISTDSLSREKIDPEHYKKQAEKLKKRKLGRLFVKEYPTSQAHAGHFRHLMSELKTKKGFVPEIVFIDYINICASSRYKAGAGANSYTIIKSIAEELRGLAVETGTAFFTATQTNRDGSNNDNIDMTSTSESFGLPMSLDWFAAMVQPKEFIEMNRQAIILLKTRFGNKNGMKKQTVGINWENMRYYDVGGTNNLAEVNDINEKVNEHKPNFKSKDSVKNIAWD